MKESGIDWIGTIPDSWEVVPFRSYAEMRREKNKGEKTRELLALSFALGVTLYRDKVYNMDRVKENYEDYQIVYENDLVLSPNDIIKGSVYVSKYYGCISPMYLVFSARDKKHHHLPYLSYLLRTQEAGRKFFFIARGLIGDILENGKYVTRRMSVSKQDLMSFSVLLPSFAEQQKIAEFLDKKCCEVDEMIALQEQIIEELKAYKQSVITEAVTKGLNPNVPMKDSGIEWIGEIPEHWEVKRLKYVSNISRGLFNHRPRNDERYYGGIHPFIQTGDVARSNKYIKSYSQTLSDLGISVSKLFPKGTLTMTIAANVGDVSILGFNAYFPDSVLGIIPVSGVDNIFLYYALKAMKGEFVNAAILSTQLNLNVERVYNMKAVMPPFSEQQQIASYLDIKCPEIDYLIALKLAKIEELKEYKKSIIYEYVTGKKEVPGLE